MAVAFAFPLLFMAFIAVLVVVPLVFWVISLVEVSSAPEQAFGPPWDNGKTPWILGLVVGMLIPAGALVATILWWVQGHQALRAGRPVPKPFWSPSRAPYPYPPQHLPPPPPQPPQY